MTKVHQSEPVLTAEEVEERFNEIRALTADEKMALPAKDLAWYRAEKARRAAGFAEARAYKRGDPNRPRDPDGVPPSEFKK